MRKSDASMSASGETGRWDLLSGATGSG